jgi:hypothetical protein
VIYAFVVIVKFLAKVDDTFWIQGRGIVLVPGQLASDFRIRVGTVLQIRIPNGRSIDTHITGVEFLKSRDSERCQMAILVTRDVARDSVPSDSEIWYVHEDIGPTRPATPPHS